jgi:uroporphyrin-III C-methyltransferase
MSTDKPLLSDPEPPAVLGPEISAVQPPMAAPAPTDPAAKLVWRWSVALPLLVAALALLLGLLLWQKISGIQSHLAKQSADAGQMSAEAMALSKQATDQVQAMMARLALAEAKLSEVALQRSQLEELMQSLSRSRDENLVVDIESALRLAQQQAQLTGSVEPLLAALRSAEQRIAKTAQPRLAPVRRAILQDLERLKSAKVADTPGLLIRMDGAVSQLEDLPLVSQVGSAVRRDAVSQEKIPAWVPQAWQSAWQQFMVEVMRLLRVTRVDHADALLLAPEQTFFVRENLKLLLLNARIGLLSRQYDAVRHDLDKASQSIRKHAMPDARKTQVLLQSLAQMQQQLQATEIPRLDGTLSALATAAAGR